MPKNALLVLALLVATATLAHAEKMDNPEYLNWKQFKPGAWVKLETLTTIAGTETRTVTTTTLKKVTDEKAVVSSQTTLFVMGNEMKQPAEDKEIPATFDRPEVPAGTDEPDLEIEEGEETLTVGGKEIACTWVKSTVKMGGNTIVSKVWSSDAVPGSMVKMESTTGGPMKAVTTMTVTEFKTE